MKEYCRLCMNEIDQSLSKVKLACGHSFHYKCFMIVYQDENGFIFNANKCLTCNYDIKNELNKECCICLDSLMTDIKKTRCNHFFHSKCLEKWDKSKGCPCCRGKY